MSNTQSRTVFFIELLRLHTQQKSMSVDRALRESIHVLIKPNHSTSLMQINNLTMKQSIFVNASQGDS